MKQDARILSSYLPTSKSPQLLAGARGEITVLNKDGK